jgi:hypothetical protein
VTSHAHSKTYGAARRCKSRQADREALKRKAFEVFHIARPSQPEIGRKSPECIRLYHYGQNAISERSDFKIGSKDFKMQGLKFASVIQEHFPV